MIRWLHVFFVLNYLVRELSFWSKNRTNLTHQSHHVIYFQRDFPISNQIRGGGKPGPVRRDRPPLPYCGFTFTYNVSVFTPVKIPRPLTTVVGGVAMFWVLVLFCLYNAA